jgi:flagellar protein FliS
MCERLLHANLHNRPELIDEVSRLLTELRGAWEEIRPAAAEAVRAQPPAQHPRAA